MIPPKRPRDREALVLAFGVVWLLSSAVLYFWLMRP